MSVLAEMDEIPCEQKLFFLVELHFVGQLQQQQWLPSVGRLVFQESALWSGNMRGQGGQKSSSFSVFQHGLVVSSFPQRKHMQVRWFNVHQRRVANWSICTGERGELQNANTSMPDVNWPGEGSTFATWARSPSSPHPVFLSASKMAGDVTENHRVCENFWSSAS